MDSWMRRQADRVVRQLGTDRRGDGPHSEAPPPSPASAIERLVGPHGRIVVLDCETTGLTSRDRVVEVALVTVDATGAIVDRWESLINPARDVGPTRIHGITGADVAHAPEFGDIAGDIAFRMHGAVLAAHNLPFDLRMLTGEFTRIGTEFDPGRGIDTLRITRARLEEACRAYGIRIEAAHRALDDAEATARLLTRVASRIGPGVRPVVFRHQFRISGRSVARGSASGAGEARVGPQLGVLVSGGSLPIPQDERPEVVAYLDLLARSLENLQIDDQEAFALDELAETAGLGLEERDLVHLEHLNRLIDRVITDGAVSDSEYDELVRIAAALGIDQGIVHRRTRGARSGTEPVELRSGMHVCVTGDPDGVSRDALERRLEWAGFVIDAAVTKRTDLLVAADVTSQSGKAEKARRYGIPIVSAASVLRAAVGDQVDAVVLQVGRLVAQVCERCGVTWTEPARSSRRRALCAECRGSS